MKRKIISLLPVLAALVLSGCSEGANSNTTKIQVSDTSATANTSKTVSETESVEVGNASDEPEGFVFRDLTGEAVDTSLVSGYTLSYAVCWQPSSGLIRIDNTCTINGLAVSAVSSSYCILTTDKGVNSVNCNGGQYYLGSAEDPFGAFSAECVLYKQSGGSDWYLRLIKKDGDEYLYYPTVYSGRAEKEAEEKMTVEADGETFSVQPIEILLTNPDDFDILNEAGSAPFKAELLIDNINIHSYAQATAYDDATMLYAGAYVREISLKNE